MADKETIREILERHDGAVKNLQKFQRRVGPEIREANLRAKEAHVGFVEVSVEQRFFKKEFSDLKQETKRGKRWLMGVFFSVMALILSIIGAVITIIKFSGGQ